jgi:hypothetical protein
MAAGAASVVVLLFEGADVSELGPHAESPIAIAAAKHAVK